MADESARIPLAGIWYRHLRAGGDPLGLPPAGAAGRWQRAHVVRALYLADTAETAWAEFYRAAAEMGLAPDKLMPRDLWRYRLDLDAVADLSDPAALAAAGLPAAAPDRTQWPEFQAVGERLARGGAAGLLYRSAARPAYRCVCLFAGAREKIEPLSHERVGTPPAPPRGMRT